MYGFIENFGENIYEAIEIPTKILIDTFESLTEDSRQLLKQKVQKMFEMDLIDDYSSIVIDSKGVSNSFETIQILQVSLTF